MYKLFKPLQYLETLVTSYNDNSNYYLILLLLFLHTH